MTKKSVEDPLLAEGSERILFLEKYNGIEDTFVCVGLYQGNYVVGSEGAIYNSINTEKADTSITNTEIDGNIAGENNENLLKDFLFGQTKDEFIKEIKILN